MGNPLRSKAFHDFYAKEPRDNTLPDQIAGHEGTRTTLFLELISTAPASTATPEADTPRLPPCFAIPTFSRSAFPNRETMTTANTRRLARSGWGCSRKMPTALRTTTARQISFGKEPERPSSAAHGTMDDNVPPYNTLLVVDELIKANKDFDLLMLPNQHHATATQQLHGTTTLGLLCRYLLGAEPPHEYQMHTPSGVGAVP